MKRTAYITVRMDTEGENERTIRKSIKENFGCWEWGGGGTECRNQKLGQIRLVRPSHRAKKVKHGN